MDDRYDKLVEWLRGKIATDTELGADATDALTDILTELEQIADRTEDLDARDHAHSAMALMAQIWVTGDEMDELWMSWDPKLRKAVNGDG